MGVKKAGKKRRGGDLSMEEDVVRGEKKEQSLCVTEPTCHIR